MILNHKRLIQDAEELDQILPSETKTEITGTRKYFCPNATESERQIFKERAKNLIKSSDSDDDHKFIPLAVVELNGEYFGIDLEVVREFSDLTDITPIPCCPNHIVGSMNLRGDILTLVDIRGSLKMPQLSIENSAKVVVLDVADYNVGIPVDNVYDIIYIKPKDIGVVPTALQSVSDEYLKGTAPYNDKMLSIINLEKMFASGILVVNEEV